MAIVSALVLVLNRRDEESGRRRYLQGEQGRHKAILRIHSSSSEANDRAPRKARSASPKMPGIIHTLLANQAASSKRSRALCSNAYSAQSLSSDSSSKKNKGILTPLSPPRPALFI